jgi:hypothetical protein
LNGLAISVNCAYVKSHIVIEGPKQDGTPQGTLGKHLAGNNTIAKSGFGRRSH